ncbi:carboxymuconolactone decarboxylase family protein [Pseudaquabacterium terrae]|uniref:carboxymuconolactone decarboxylase family protein n=1 Tax=Pseudaquabacterium terrae TaxID=2732868 RepID=UPI001FE3258C|nr:carboxymuconolactone decarboxylase family protein [Aquabacterium terrae]
MNGSGLPPREREIVMLRMGWLCQSEYEWAQHARIAKSDAGLSDADLHRIAQGPDVAGWRDTERALLRMVDELRCDAMVSDATWRALRARYANPQMLALILTAGQYQFVSMALNSLGVQLDPGLQDRLPRDLVLPAVAERPASPRLKSPRIEVATVNHPKLFSAYAQFVRYVRHESRLPSKARALLIMRTAWNVRDEIGWARHAEAAQAAGFTEAELARVAAGPSASGWSDQHAVLLQAADELHREAFISNGTWQTLRALFDQKQMIALIATVGGTAMAGLMTNSLGHLVDAERQQH